jgi:hypothetical protein
MAGLVVEDEGLGVLVVRCGRCGGGVTRLQSSEPARVLAWKREVPGWEVGWFGHVCETGGERHERDVSERRDQARAISDLLVVRGARGHETASGSGAGRGGDSAVGGVCPGARRDERRSAPAGRGPIAPEGVLWYSAEQRAQWEAQGKPRAIGVLADGREVEYTELKSGTHRAEGSVYADAVCLGPGAFVRTEES